MRRRYGIDWDAGMRWYSIQRIWRTKGGGQRAGRRVLRNAECGAARVVIVLSGAERSFEGRLRPATWSGAVRSLTPAGGYR